MADDSAFSWPLLNGALPMVLGQGTYWLQLLLVTAFIMGPRFIHLGYIHFRYDTKRKYEQVRAQR